jgi:hypothetical protein
LPRCLRLFFLNYSFSKGWRWKRKLGLQICNYSFTVRNSIYESLCNPPPIRSPEKNREAI